MGSLSKDALKAHSNSDSIRMGIRVDPYEQSIFDCSTDWYTQN